MKFSLRRPRSPLMIALLLSFVLLAGLFMGWSSGHVISDDNAFRSLTDNIFREEVSGSMLTLHYSLAYPEKKQISRPSPSLGTISTNMDSTYQKYEQYLQKLKNFSASRLNRENQITRDMLLLYYQTQLSSRDYPLLDEPLSPSLGIQAQLPVLLAESAFYENQDIAVAVLDVMLPGIDGYEVCRAMRGAGYQAGVIMLTARTQEADKVTGLMNGADDYVTKPFSVIELAARVDALYRRVSGSPFSEDDVIKSGPFKLNLRAREVLKNGVKIELTQIEYGLLKAFMQNIGKALSRDELLEMVWGHHYVGELKIVDVNIRRLRIKIEDSPADPTHIVTVRGYGYMWEG